MASFAEYTKNQKKKKQKAAAKGKTFSEYTQEVLGRDDIELSQTEQNMAKDDDIAPVAVSQNEDEEGEKWYEGWFEKGNDNVGKAILGTLSDFASDIVTGVIGMGEKIVDGLATISPYLADAQFYQNSLNVNPELEKAHRELIETAKEENAKFVEKDLYDEEAIAKRLLASAFVSPSPLRNGIVEENLKYLNEEMEADSVLGHKTDSLAQSGGQLAATAGLQAVGIPWWLTSGATAFGGEAENAFKSGATYEEAVLSATIAAGAEVLTEKISGGISFGGKTLDDGLTMLLSKNIANKFVRTGLKLGMDAVGEGAEEWLTEDISRFGQWLTYRSDEELKELLFSEEAMNEKIEAFIGGAALGGGSSSVNAVKSELSGVDYVTELTKNEQAVVDKVVENEIAKAEESGKELSKKDRNDIRNEAVGKLKRGEVSVDTIEELFGGDSYKAYRDIVEQEKPLRDEIASIKSNKTLTDEQKQTLIASVESKLNTLAEETNKAGVRSELDEIMRNTLTRQKGKQTVTDRYLIESYNEDARSKQKFEVDLSKYEGKEREILEGFMKKGQLNNKRSTHEFWEYVAKSGAERNLNVTTANTAEILEMVKERYGEEYVKENFPEGVIPNGFIMDDGTLAINLKSVESRQFVFGHEIGHTMEKLKEYAELQKLLYEYGENYDAEYFNKRKASVDKLYKNIKGSKADIELTNDLIGKYVYGDTDFIYQLSTKNRNIFQKVWDEVKHLYKMATAGSQEARDLERIKKKFEDAYRKSANEQKNTAEGGMNFHISETFEAEIDKTLNNELDTSSQVKARDYTPDILVQNGVKNLPMLITQNHVKSIVYTEAEAKKLGLPVGKNINYHGLGKELLMESVDNMDSPSAIYRKDADHYIIITELRNSAGDNIIIPVKIDGKGTYNDVYIDENQILSAYGKKNLQNYLENNNFVLIYEKKETALNEGVQYSNISDSLEGSVPQNGKNVKMDFSLSDSDGRKLTKEQSDYFKDSKMRDENGSLKVMYHGSENAGFHEFNARFSDDDTSFFFVDRNDVAATYSGTTETYEARTIRTVEDMNNFLEEIGEEDYRVVEENGKFTLLQENEKVADSDTAQGIYEEYCDWVGVGYGDANYKVYLNLKNPLVVDAEGRNWNRLTGEFSQEVYDRYKSLTDAEKTALTQLAAWEDASIFRDEIQTAVESVERGASYVDDYTRSLASAAEKLGDADMYRLFDIATDNFSEESLRENAVKYLNTREYAKRAKEGGYDGVIFKNIHDNGVYADGTEGASTVAIAFESNQIKSVANEKPTGDADIRFSMSEAVEETRDLMALHNLKSDELIKSIELGGMPMPSIAIIKAEAGHEQYGDVSLILPKETIDPKKSRYNKVYGGDAWTPTYPKIEYKPNEAVEKKISDKYYELARKIGYDDVRPMYRYVNEMEDTLNRYGGEEDMLKDLYEDTRMMQVYLADTGKGKVDTIQKEIRTELSDAEVEMNEFFIKQLGADVVDAVMVKNGENPMAHRKQYWEEHGEKIKETYKKLLSEEYGFTDEEVQNVIDSTKTFDYLKHVRDAYLYRKNGRVTTKTEADIAATDEAIRQAAADGYREWVDGLFKGIEEKSGIRNNAEYFTLSGNRRSWDALHWENTLENVVRVMRQQNQTGADAIFGATQIFATATKEYGSIADIKADSDRLYKMSEDEYKAVKESYTNRMNDIAHRIMDKSERNQFIALDNAMECIVDAVRNSKTKAGIYKELKEYSQLNVTETDVDDIVSLVTDISNMPTGYFEAKPMRAVGFDEVGVFVIPNNADIKLKQELLNRGYSIAEYDPQVEGDRQRVVNSFEEYKFSLYDTSEAPTRLRGDLPLSDSMLVADEVAPTEEVAPVGGVVDESEFTSQPTAYDIERELEALVEEGTAAANKGDYDTVNKLYEKYLALTEQKERLEAEEAAMRVEEFASLDDADAPLPEEMYRDETPDTTPLTKKAVEDIAARIEWMPKGQQKELREVITEYVNSENPSREQLYEEVRDRFGIQYETQKDERAVDVKRYLRTTPLNVSDKIKSDIADYGKDVFRQNHLSRLRFSKKGLAVDEMYAELVELYPEFFDSDITNPTDQLLRIVDVANTDSDIVTGFEVDSDTLSETVDTIINGINEYRRSENEKAFARTYKEANEDLVKHADEYAPPTDEVIAPIAEEYEAIRPKRETQPRLKRVDSNTQTKTEQHTAQVLDSEPTPEKKKNRFMSQLAEKLLDKGLVFENLSKKHKNRELEAKWNFIRSSDSRAQTFMKEGADGVKSLDGIRKEVEQSGLTKPFYEYLYHALNVDRMTLSERYEDIENKAVFGDSVTADMSREAVKQFEAQHPEFKQWAKDVYDYNTHLRKMMVDKGVISQEVADLWAEMYPHYVPIRRVGDTGLNVNVPLDTGRTGVNAPIKKATGGNRDILPLFDTMAQRTLQTYKAVARNSFGVELKNTLGTTIANEATDIDGIIDSVDTQDGLLQEGKNGKKPTFTVFENGEKVTFEITEDMYDALKPTSEMLSYRNKVASTASSIFRGLLTEYNPVFMATNAIKDVQDVLMNSQHAGRTYLNIPRAITELTAHGKWYTEYMRNGGGENTYFEKDTNTFTEEKSGLRKIVGMPFDAISAANNFIERVPRLAEYIASRESGRSIEVSMLDAARVTTNFAAGGDVTKFLNRNGFTFLNASVQGAMQQVRNVREAKMNGLKGWANLATKVALAGLPAMLLNGLLWDDDEDYEELSDYVKQNYYVVWKYGDGQFIRIPKGRALAVIQNGLEQMGNLVTGNDEVDLATFLDLVVTNLAPNNPLDNNILAPIMQAARNETWYGEDLVPTRLQDLPAAEQFDESTDALSKWLGETFNVSPYKINYVLNQYSGGLGDVFMPMMTPEAERGDNSLLGNIIAPFKDKFTTDGVMKNQNVSDFYDTMDELTTNAKASTATDEDVLRYKFFNSMNAELSELYKQKREIQNSDLPNDKKYEAVRELQKEINEIAREALSNVDSVRIDGNYAVVGDKHYRLDDGVWTKISDKQLARQKEVTSSLGISPSEYWSKTDISFLPMANSEYEYAYDNPEKYAVAKAVGGYDAYKQYSSELYDIKADKDSSGKSISGSRKAKVLDYINNLDADYGEKLILFKSEYNADDTYNREIVEYLNGRDDISYDEMVTILKELGFTVHSNGTVTW